MKIIIVGYGIVGSNLAKEIKKLKPEIYDKYKQIDTRTHKNYNIAFVCVDTPINEKYLCDITEVINAINETDAEIYVKKGGKLKIKGSVETESGIADLKLSVNGTGFEVKDEDVSEGSGNLKLYKSLTDGGESEFEYEIDFDSEANKAIFSQSVSKKYILRVTATQGKPSETGISFTYDVDGPVVKGYSASPVVNGNTRGGTEQPRRLQLYGRYKGSKRQ